MTLTVETCRRADLTGRLRLPADVFLCCASFESRCRAVADAIPPEAVRKVLVADNRNLAEYVGDNAAYLRDRFAPRARDVALDSHDPLVTADSLQEALNSVASDEPMRYLVDITTFTHESLLILYRLLTLHTKAEDDVTLVYTNTADYCPGDNPEGKWLSKGVAEVRSVLGYPGEMIPSKKTHLVILVGYERERALALIGVFQPNLLSLGYGKAGSSHSLKHYEANRYFHKLVAQAAATYGMVSEFEFSCNDPWETKQTIMGCIAGASDCNHILAPMNTKISTLGSALVANVDGTVQLCYAQPLQYNYSNYSTPGEMCYFMNLRQLATP